MAEDKQPEEPLSEEPSAEQSGRREALLKLAVYSACTAPLLLGMLKSEKAAAFTF